MAWEFDRRALLGMRRHRRVAWHDYARGASAKPNARFAVDSIRRPSGGSCLGPQRYRILREAGTERALFRARSTRSIAAGVFACAGCGLPLFSSTTKFDSGTGWPSFFRRFPKCGRHQSRPQPADGADGSAVPPLRRASRPCVRRRAEADRPALLHERACPELPAGLTSQHADRPARLLRRHADDRQPVHPAGAAVRFRARRPRLRARRACRCLRAWR